MRRKEHLEKMLRIFHSEVELLVGSMKRFGRKEGWKLKSEIELLNGRYLLIFILCYPYDSYLLEVIILVYGALPHEKSSILLISYSIFSLMPLTYTPILPLYDQLSEVILYPDINNRSNNPGHGIKMCIFKTAVFMLTTITNMHTWSIQEAMEQ